MEIISSSNTLAAFTKHNAIHTGSVQPSAGVTSFFNNCIHSFFC